MEAFAGSVSSVNVFIGISRLCPISQILCEQLNAYHPFGHSEFSTMDNSPNSTNEGTPPRDMFNGRYGDLSCKSTPSIIRALLSPWSSSREKALNGREERSLKSLSTSEVQQILQELQFPESVQCAFRSECIDGQALAHVKDADDITELGVKKVHAKRLFSIVCCLQELDMERQSDDLNEPFFHYIQARYSGIVSSVSWLEHQQSEENIGAKTFWMLLRQKPVLEQFRNDVPLSSWLESQDAEVRMHAECIMGLCFDDDRGAQLDYAQAILWHSKAAVGGHMESQYRLGDCYFCGNGVEQDYTMAVQWFRQSASQGHPAAQYMLGVCFHRGQGVPQDHEQAVSWWNLSAAQHQPDALYWLGVSFTRGEGVTQDSCRAATLFRASALKGNSNASFMLGECLRTGNGTPQDFAQAAYWTHSAAMWGHPMAQLRLSWCFLHGCGVLPDQVQAEDWHKRAQQSLTMGVKDLPVPVRMGKT